MPDFGPEPSLAAADFKYCGDWHPIGQGRAPKVQEYQRDRDGYATRNTPASCVVFIQQMREIYQITIKICLLTVRHFSNKYSVT